MILFHISAQDTGTCKEEENKIDEKRALGCGPNSGHISKALLPRGIWYKTNCQPFSLLSVLA